MKWFHENGQTIHVFFCLTHSFVALHTNKKKSSKIAFSDNNVRFMIYNGKLQRPILLWKTVFFVVVPEKWYARTKYNWIWIRVWKNYKERLLAITKSKKCQFRWANCKELDRLGAKKCHWHNKTNKRILIWRGVDSRMMNIHICLFCSIHHFRTQKSSFRVITLVAKTHVFADIPIQTMSTTFSISIRFTAWYNDRKSKWNVSSRP